MISNYLNKSYSFESKTLECKVFVKSPNGIIDKSPITHYDTKKYLLIDYDINSLEEGYIYALNLNKSEIKFKFNSAIEAARNLDPSKLKKDDVLGRYISRYLNQERLVRTELGDFYFVINPQTLIKLKSKGYHKVLWVINLTTGLAIKYNNTIEATRSFNLANSISIRKHLDKFTIYKNNYQFVSQTKFVKLFPNAIDIKYQCDLNKLPLKTNDHPLSLYNPNLLISYNK